MKKFAVLLLIAAMFSGCALFGGSGAIKPWSQMQPQEKSLYFVQTFNMQFQDTLAMAKRPGLTEAQKTVVREKKRLLEQAKPLIAVYDIQASHGDVGGILVDYETQILTILNELLMQGADKIGLADPTEELRRLSAESARRANETYQVEEFGLTGRL